MAELAIQCLICLECFEPNQIDKVACESTVAHNLCHGCEKIWRDKAPLELGIHRMKCPACQQPEISRTIESLQREIESLQREAKSSLKVAPVTSAVARARLTPMTIIDAIRPLVTTITPEELDVINARLMGRPRPTAVAETDFERILQRNAERRTAVAPTLVVAPVIDTVRRERKLCASGRNCRSTSQSGRATTHLKCIHCNLVFCCRTCNECVGCRPFPAYLLPYVERLRL